LINPDNNTFTTPIPTPINAVPPNSKNTPGSDLTPTPTAILTKASPKARSNPTRLPTPGAIGETAANAKSGNIPKAPAPAVESPASRRMVSSNGPTDVKVPRIVVAISTIPTTAPRVNVVVRSMWITLAAQPHLGG
jgi:hypothetical protein